MHITTISFFFNAMNLKKSGKGYIGEFGGRKGKKSVLMKL